MKTIHRYTLDTEFIEGFKKPPFSKRRHFIDLISIGLCSERGREYYAISRDFNPSNASDWVKEHVLKPIVVDYIKQFSGDARNGILNELEGKSLVGQVNALQQRIGKTNRQIVQEVINFVYQPAIEWGDGLSGVDNDLTLWLEENEIRFYGYYGDYDWVLFCSLFGTMMDLPEGFPMYLRDLKQVLDEHRIDKATLKAGAAPVGEHNALADARWNLGVLKEVRKLTQVLQPQNGVDL